MVHEECFLGRYTMYKKIEKWISNEGFISEYAIGKTVGGVSPLVIHYPKVKWEITNITPYKTLDDLEWIVDDHVSNEFLELGDKSVNMENLPWEDNSVDIIMSDQTLEHVPHPWIAAKELTRVLKPKGILILTTVCLNKWHGPANYFNFQRQGLQSLFHNYLNKYRIDSWGNQEALNILFGISKKTYTLVKLSKELKKLADTNDYFMPYVVWICGRK